jgi:hypothetical protein
MTENAIMTKIKYKNGHKSGRNIFNGYCIREKEKWTWSF